MSAPTNEDDQRGEFTISRAVRRRAFSEPKRLSMPSASKRANLR
jgi:hypothetical protein